MGSRSAGGFGDKGGNVAGRRIHSCRRYDIAPAITLHANLIYSQADPILDLVMLGTGSDQHMVILGPQAIRAVCSGARELAGSEKLCNRPFAAVSPRHAGAYRARVGSSVRRLSARCGLHGDEKWRRLGFELTCGDSDDPWPHSVAEGVLQLDEKFLYRGGDAGLRSKAGPFLFRGRNHPRRQYGFLFNDVSGAVHLLEGNSHKMLIGARDWGSDFASVRSGCGQGMQLLSSAAGWPAVGFDSRLRDHGPRSDSGQRTLELRRSHHRGMAVNDGTAATVVVQKPQEFRYEAYSVSVVCSR